MAVLDGVRNLIESIPLDPWDVDTEPGEDLVALVGLAPLNFAKRYGLRRSVATATAHAQVPVVVAAAMTGHSPAVYSAHYARPFRDAEEREKVRNSLAAIGFGNTAVDQPVDQRPI